ncbi:hypothetical protein ACOTTU_18835 [Roseobacter sp. EG26]
MLDFDNVAMVSLMEAETRLLQLPTIQTLEAMAKTRSHLGLDGYRALPSKLVTKLPEVMAAGDDANGRALLEGLNRYAQARHVLMSDAALSPRDLRDRVWAMHEAHLAILRNSLPTARYAMVAPVLRTRVSLLIGLERGFEVVSRVSAPVARWLAAVTGDTGIERWAHRTAGILRQFFTHEALLYTGLETSWGFRVVIPGTGGIGANMGGWVMLYSGSLKNYLSDAVPMRINPGFTLATAVFVWTFNRPGIGFGPSVPWGNAYVDAHRYKLLIGFDGVGYVRTGEWRGRGPYSTVSGSLPLMPGIRITWNASVFSPGFVPLVRYSTPFAQRMQKHAEGLTNWIASPFKKGK